MNGNTVHKSEIIILGTMGLECFAGRWTLAHYQPRTVKSLNSSALVTARLKRGRTHKKL